jgi:hypothetical protein
VGVGVEEGALLGPVEHELLVRGYIAAFMVSCGEKIKRYMLSQGHRGGFNMDLCWACVGNWLSHIETEPKKQPNTATKSPSLTDLWKF